MATVTLPRLDIPITGRAQINSEWYRWARDVTARIGGVVAPNLEDLLQAPPVLVVQSSVSAETAFEQSPPVPTGSDAVDWQPPVALPGSDATEWQPPAAPPGSDATEWQPPATPLAEPFDWLQPPALPTEERVEWLENQVAQLRAVIDDLSRLVAGLQQGLDA
jgi:hypothetical protein